MALIKCLLRLTSSKALPMPTAPYGTDQHRTLDIGLNQSPVIRKTCKQKKPRFRRAFLKWEIVIRANNRLWLICIQFNGTNVCCFVYSNTVSCKPDAFKAIFSWLDGNIVLSFFKANEQKFSVVLICKGG